jgi:hypothetical protein
MGDRASTNITLWISSIEGARDARRAVVDEGRAPGAAGDVRGEGRARRGSSCGRLRAACLVARERMKWGHCAASRGFSRDAVLRLARGVGTEEGVRELGSGWELESVRKWGSRGPVLLLYGYAHGRLPTAMLGSSEELRAGHAALTMGNSDRMS